MHSWGDTQVDWDGIEDAAYYIGNNLCRWARVNASWKEKWGTVRVSCSFGWYEPLHGLLYPGYVYYKFPKWLIALDHRLVPLSTLLNKVLVPYQILIYKYLYWRAVKKWPHLREEILRGADWYEHLYFLGPLGTLKGRNE